MKHAVGLLILEDNTIFFKYCGILGCSLIYLFWETSALKNRRPFIFFIIIHLAFLPDKRSLLSKGMIDFTKLPINNGNTMSTRFSTCFPTAYYSKFDGFGNLGDSCRLLDSSHILLITVLLSPLQMFIFSFYFLIIFPSM